MSTILTNLLKEKFGRLIFLPCVCFASIHASTAAKSYILNYMWTVPKFIIEGRRLCTVGLSNSYRPGLFKMFGRGPHKLLHNNSRARHFV